MIRPPRQITLDQRDRLYESLRAEGEAKAEGECGGESKAAPWPAYAGTLRRHVEEGDLRLTRFLYDNSPAAMRLWSFLLTEELRLNQARAAGQKLLGAMKDLGTVPVMAYSLAGVTAFYPDGAWWVPCIMQRSSGDLEVADRLGVDESFCPVRAMLGAFVRPAHFPPPDLLVCSVGATCDDFSAIAQRLEALGHPILWWEIPHRRRPAPGEQAVTLSGGFQAPQSQVDFVRGELHRVGEAIEHLSGRKLEAPILAEGIRQANVFRRLLDELRVLAYTADPCPMGALEMLVVEMLAIHFCSDRQEAIAVVTGLLEEVRARAAAGVGVGEPGAARVFWVNPVADLGVMNLLEECGGRLCGTEFLFSHALDEIPTDVEPMEALARTALADPMVGDSADRAERICRDARRFGAEALVVSRIPGASHCATESAVIRELVAERLGIPVVQIEVPPIADSLAPSIRTRLEALIESARQPARRPDAVNTDKPERS